MKNGDHRQWMYGEQQFLLMHFLMRHIVCRHWTNARQKMGRWKLEKEGENDRQKRDTELLLITGNISSKIILRY